VTHVPNDCCRRVVGHRRAPVSELCPPSSVCSVVACAGPGCACFTGCDPTDLVEYSALGQGTRGDCRNDYTPVNTTCVFKKNETRGTGNTAYTVTTWGALQCNKDVVSYTNPNLLCPGDLTGVTYTADKAHCTLFTTLKSTTDCSTF